MAAPNLLARRQARWPSTLQPSLASDRRPARRILHLTPHLSPVRALIQVIDKRFTFRRTQSARRLLEHLVLFSSAFSPRRSPPRAAEQRNHAPGTPFPTERKSLVLAPLDLDWRFGFVGGEAALVVCAIGGSSRCCLQVGAKSRSNESSSRTARRTRDYGTSPSTRRARASLCVCRNPDSAVASPDIEQSSDRTRQDAASNWRGR